ncbi:hemagglutinin repeat-containing protein [Achromobacter xylosoxidans]
MNRNIYRIVFNRTLGLFQVVAEIARRDGRRTGPRVSAARSRFLATLGPLRFAVAFALGQAVIVPLANAQIVADLGAPGNQRPTVLEAPNGVPLVNIQTPSGAGVSRNTYRRFDVGQQGAILNNARTNTQTQLGGWVQGNPWLARGTARVILNEVNSSDPSRLNGYVEVAGDRAQLVIANPAGISCDGCGFINADRATITTGGPVINGGSLESYRVQRGAIQVNGKGMDASATNYTDLIARSVEANAGIWARQLQVTTGTNEVSADHARVQTIAASGDAPVFALDVGALGGMYSQKIVLVGTEHGVGVRNAGMVGAQAGQLVVTTDGRLDNLGTMQAGADARINAVEGLANAGMLSAGRELTVYTPEDIDNSGGTLNARRVDVTAQSLTNRGGVIGQTGLQDLALQAGQISNRDGGRIGIAAPQTDTPSGEGEAPKAGMGGGTGGGNSSTSGDSPHGANAGGDGTQPAFGIASLPGGVLNIAGTLDNEGGHIMAGGPIDLIARDGLDNDTGHLGVRQFAVSGGGLSNRRGEIRVAAGARITTGLLNNDAGLMQLDGPVVLNARDFSNRAGAFRHSDRSDTHIRITGVLDNSDSGAIAGNGDLRINAATLANANGNILHAGDGRLAINAAALHGGNGNIASNGMLDLKGDTTDLTSATTQARTVRIDTGALTTARGTLRSSGRLDVRVRGTLDNRDGQIVSTEGRLGVATPGHTGNAGGTPQGAGDVSLASGGLDNAGGTVLGASVAVDTHLAALDNTGGTIASIDGTLSIDSGALNNARGLLQSRQGMHVDTHAQTLTNTYAGSTGGILSGDTLALSSGNLNNRDGVVYSQGELVARAGDIDNTAGQLGAGADADIGATALDNAGGRVQAANDLKAALSGVANNNGGLMVAGNGLALNAAQILNRDTQSADAGQPLGLQGDSVVLTASRTDNTAGAIAADSLIDIRGPDAAGLLDNTHGNISSGGGIDVTVSRVQNPQGTLIAGRTLDLAADSLGGDGRLLSGGDLSLSLQQDFANLREITANGHAVIRTAGVLTNDGVMRAGDLEVHGADVNNNASGEMSGMRTTVAAHNTLTNRGLIDGSQTRIDAGTLDNVGSGRLYGDHLAIGAGTANNREEDGHAAVLAARQRLDIGAGIINNREKALIFSAGGSSDALNIGGMLDANDQATASADLILNDSATIESLGGLTLDGARLLNRNLHFRTELAQISGPTRRLYIQPGGDPEKHDASEYRWERWSRAGRYRHGKTGAKIQDWTQYDVNQSEYETRVTESAPALIRAGGDVILRGEELVNDKSRIIAGGVLRGDLDHLDNLAAIGEHVIHQAGTSQYTRSRWRGGRRQYHQRKWDRKIAYAPADMVKTFDLDVSSIVQNAAGKGSGFAVTDRQNPPVDARVGGGVRATGGIGPGQITEVRVDVGRVHGPGAVTETHATDGNGPVQIPGQEVAGSNGGAPEIVRTVRVDTDVPASSLFRIVPDASGYLVETDPRFADYRNWLSSDYMLSQLGYDPATVHKRLGDGFYEQQLVRDQVGQLTGRRFLDGHADDEAQYRALLEAGATYAKAWSLRPGVALSAAQMARLTSDIVWLVERDVTLADGSATRALVPQVYVRVKPGDIDGNGTLLAASTVDLNLKGDLVNTGTVAGRAVVRFTGENLRNIGGHITGDAVALDARTDIDNIGGTLDAGSALELMAGRDLNVVSTTHSGARQAGRSDFSRASLDRVAGLYVTNPGGILLASAGRDVGLIAGRVVNSGKEGQTTVVAGRDLALGTVRIAEQENNVGNAHNYLKQGYVEDVGSQISTAGDLRLQAGRDLNATAASVTSEQGVLAAVAQGDVNILAGEASSYWAEGRQHKSRSLLGSSKKTTRDSLEEARAVASTFSGDTVAVRGQNVTVTGSNVVSDAGTVIMAHNDLILRAATETSKESHFSETRKSGFLYNGGLAFTIGDQMQSGDRKDINTRAAASTAGSTGGDVMLVAGNHYQQIGSHVLALRGDIDIDAKKVDIVEARETRRSVQENKFRQSGLTVAISAPVLSAIETAGQMTRAASQTSDGRVQALAGAATGLAAKNAYDAVRADPKAAGGVNISITVGASKSDSKSTATHDTAAGSIVAAGGDVRISATGGGRNSDLTMRGSEISAAGAAVLKADGDINLLAARNTVETDRKTSNSSAGVGAAISMGQGGPAFGVTANASGARGKGESKDVTWTNNHVAAGERLTLESGGAMRLRGAVARGRLVMADAGGSLNIESLQDTSTFKSRDSQIGGSVTVGAGFSASGSYASSQVDGDFASVVERSRLEAGDDGFQIRARDNIDLRGAAIASSEDAVKRGLNTVMTGSLTVSDIENHSRYKATGVSLSGGFSVAGDGKQSDGQKEGGGSARKADEAAASNVAGKGDAWSVRNFGNSASAGAPGMSVRKGSENSMTRTGISGAAVTITDPNVQWERTGKTADQVLAMLDRSVLAGDGAGGLTKKWNGDKLRRQVQAEAEIIAAFGQQAGAAIERHAEQKRAELRQQIKATQDPEKIEALQAQINEINTQERLLNVAVGALGGSGGVAALQAGLSEAADRMRRYTIGDSEKFAGITDGETTLDNKSGESAGIRGDGFKTAGTRVVLDKLCGEVNERCRTQLDANGKSVLDANGIPKLELDGNGRVRFDPSQVGMTMAEFLESDLGKEMSGPTGGNQGGPGTLLGFAYSPGGILDLAHEAYGGSHDFIGGTLSGYYDEQGNARRGLTPVQDFIYETWTAIALVPATPFALSEALPPQAWKALDILLRMKR